MPKLPSDYEGDFARWVGKVYYKGNQFFPTKEEAKAEAKKLREQGIKARAVVIPENHNLYNRGFVERYLVMIPVQEG